MAPTNESAKPMTTLRKIVWRRQTWHPSSSPHPTHPSLAITLHLTPSSHLHTNIHGCPSFSATGLKKLYFFLHILCFLSTYIFPIIMAAAANNRSLSLNFLFWFAILFMAALATGRPIVEERPCEEIYMVGEGETLQTIIEKCNAPFILFDNPHIQDADDIYEGVPLKITYQR